MARTVDLMSKKEWTDAVPSAGNIKLCQTQAHPEEMSHLDREADSKKKAITYVKTVVALVQRQDEGSLLRNSTSWLVSGFPCPYSGEKEGDTEKSPTAYRKR